MSDQLIIKVILIAVFLALALLLVVPARGARHVAMRRLVLILAFILAALAVVFPGVLTAVAHAVGIGRGTDLLLYGLIVVFAGNALITQRHLRKIERELTLLARREAIAEAERPSTEEVAESG